jgi:hypothetical protein
MELQQIFEEPILKLEILRAQERSLGPDDWLETLHLESHYQKWGAVSKAGA